MAVEKDTLEKQFNEIEEQYKDIPKRKRSFRIYTLVFAVLIAALMGIVYYEDKTTNESNINNYLQSTDEDTLNGLLENGILADNEECYLWYEANLLGIKNNTALAGVSRTCGVNTCYFNQKGNIAAYRDEKSGRLIIQKDGAVIYEGQDAVGEIIMAGNQVFYIDTEDESSVYLFTTDDLKSIKIIDKKVQQFAMYGRQLVYLDEEENLVLYKINGGSEENIAKNIQHFFAGSTIVAQNGNQVVAISLTDGKVSSLIKDSIVVGRDNNHVYYTEFGPKKDDGGITSYHLYCMDLQTGECSEIEETDVFIRAVYTVNDEIFIDEIYNSQP